MKKIVLILMAMLFTASMAFGEITDCEITATTTEYTPETTVDLEFHLDYYSSDYEYLDGAYLDFPAGVTVNSAVDIGYLTYNGETGDGVQVTWGSITGHSGYGDQYADADFTVNVTISAAKFTGDMDIDWFINGDGYGSEPHTISGTATISEAIAGAPGDPTNPNPVDDATGVAISGNLTWDFGADTDTYDLWFGEAGSMTQEVTGEVAGASGTYAYSGLSEGTEYEWQVIAHNSTKATTNGPVWSFTTLMGPGNDCTDPIIITIPADLPYSDAGQTTCGRLNDYDATCLGNYDGGEDIIYELTVTTTTVVDITLDPKTTTYTGICIDDACPPGDPCIDKSTNSGGSAHGMTGVVLAAGTYYIMIDTWPSPDCIPDFDLTIIDAAPVTPPNCAINPDPSDTETNVQVNANLSWSDGGGIPYGYKIFFGTDNPPTNIENGTDLGLVTTYDPASDMDYSTTHYWQIVPYNPNGDAAGCSVWSFTTQDNPNYGGGGANSGGYYFANSTTGASGAPSQPTYSWVDITTTGNVIPTLCADDEYWALDLNTLGFSFTHFGTTWGDAAGENLYISSNGWMRFDTGCTSSSYSNTDLPTPTFENGIMPFWDDLDPSDAVGGNVYYELMGDGTLVVEYYLVPKNGGSAATSNTFEVIFYPSNGNIKFQYFNGAMLSVLTSSTVGIQGGDGNPVTDPNNGYIKYLYDGTGGPLQGSGLALMFGTDENTLPVEILAGSFQALYTINDAGVEYVTVNWSTVTETDINGFNIYRSYEDDIATAGNHINTSLIPGYGTTTEIHDYAFEDITADVYSTYYYWLEVVDIGGQTNFHGPITFIPEEENPHPNDIPTTMLFGNYPNPVENSTTIRYQIQGPLSAQNATISIYNILGELVRKVDGEDRQAVLDVSELPTGIYFYKLETDTYHSVKKMVIVR